MFEEVLQALLQKLKLAVEEYEQFEEELADCGIWISGEGHGSCGTKPPAPIPLG